MAKRSRSVTDVVDDGGLADGRQVEIPIPGAPETGVVTYGRSLIPAQNTPLNLCPTSFDVTSDKGKRALFNALGEPTIPFDAQGALVIDATDYLIHPVEQLDEETGELKNYVRLCLFNQFGNFGATTSEVVISRLVKLLDVFGPAPWEPPIRLLVTEKKARRSGRTYHDVKVLEYNDPVEE